ncbi:hypothetical protein FQA39_LY04777 [Lamprigera yunnana]|nr:hypothetical protein FQA39_LY04777 [Lamprigera yunnana]
MNLYLYHKNQPSTSASKKKHIESKETQCGSIQINENESDNNDQIVTSLSILDGEFFKLISKENSKTVAQRITCNKKICESTTSTGNFRCHIVQAVPIQGQKSLPPSMLASVSPEEQKKMIGERLFSLGENIFSKISKKITGMLLENDHNEILKLRVQEAVYDQTKQRQSAAQINKNH